MTHLGLGKVAKNIGGKEIGPTIPSRSISSLEIITIKGSQKGCVHNILKRLWIAVVQLNQAP